MMDAIDWWNHIESNQFLRTEIPLWVLNDLIRPSCRHAFECHDHIT